MIYDLRFTIAASVHCVTREAGRSPATDTNHAMSRFSGFVLHAKPLKRLNFFLRIPTGLKPGANERVCR
jgi:hypothetical protein